MRIALYAPMKPPDHPVPSGDRCIARLLMRALRDSGHDVAVASRLRSYDRDGDRPRQRRIQRRGAQLAQRFIERHRDARPDLWFTYHLYHKAPDWLGPAVSNALSIPYVVADASVAPKQAAGPWADGHNAVEAAVARADRVIAFDPTDIPCVAPLLATPERLSPMMPFTAMAPPRAGERQTARQHFAAAHGVDPDTPWLVTVAMMRNDAKRDSYAVLADALDRLDDGPWSLLIAGDGAARGTVESLFAHSRHAARVRFLGQLDRTAVRRLYRAADIAAWPAVREGCAMALVEAQALGVPVVAGTRPGIAQVVEDGATGRLVPVGDAAAFADAVNGLLADPARLDAMKAATNRACGRLDPQTAARQLDAILCAAAAEARA